MEEKYDGDRLILVYEDTKAPRSFLRTGEEGVLPSVPTLDLSPLNSRHAGVTIFDCELMQDGNLYVFDLLKMRGVDLCGMMYVRRREVLENLFEYFQRQGFNLVASYSKTEQKHQLFESLKQSGEGVMFKHADSIYRFDYRSKDWRKFKFYKTCSVVITELYREGKPESVTICVMDGSRYHEVSGCKIPDRYQRELDIQVGDVIEVRYLTLTPDRKITQPVFIRKRRDLLPHEATLERLIDESK